jgi:iron complex outermembrane receptor protein
MNELLNARANRQDFRWCLLTTVSAMALTASVYGGGTAYASNDDSGSPLVWIELGDQLERLDDGQAPFAPPFFDAIANGGFKSPLEAGKPAIYSNGLEGSISFMPAASDWIFSGSVRYGRSEGHRFLHQQDPILGTHVSFGTGATKYKVAPPNYVETRANNSESHFIADFQASKDVGLGMFGSTGASTVGLGIRFAQFAGKSNLTVRARPDDHFVQTSLYGYHFPNSKFHAYFGSVQRAAGFRGVGPSISWKASTPLAGHPREGEISLDWGVNAAVLFGRQKAQVQHHESGHYKNNIFNQYYSTGYQHSGGHGNVRSVTVPNIGGFAGVSFLYSDAKVSFGYRGDFFFGAMDGGIDAAKKENVGFYGPFATISVGIGG